MARGIVGEEKGRVFTPKQLERFTKEWDAARKKVLYGLGRRKAGQDGQSSGKTYSYRKRVP